MTRASIHIETELLHGGRVSSSEDGATVSPIVQSTSFAYDSAEALEAVFAGRDPGFVYSRINNPTIAAFERRMASIEGGLGAVCCASGMAAISTSILALAEAGDEVVSASSIFGGSYSLFARTLPRYGITTRFVEATDVKAYEKVITNRTRAVFLETLGNPKLDVPDIAKLAEVTRAKGVPLIVDNTATTPVLCRPAELGADIVVHSTSKYINGHGTGIGGVIIDSGRFDWGAAQSGAVREYSNRAGQFAFIACLRNQIHRDLGGCFTPFNAFLMATGMESLAVRMERHCENAARLAEALNADPRVEAVRYPGLSTHPDHEVAKRQFSGRYGALVTLRLGSKERCFSFINALERVDILANLGDVRTLAIHPASTFCRDATDEERKAMGVSDDLVRLSVGIEHIDDIMADVDQALTQP